MTGPDDLIRRGDVLRIFEPETSMVRRRICGDVRAIQPDTDSLQQRANDWALACFGAESLMDKTERAHRFGEESLELVQACGVTKDEVLQLVDYVFAREKGDVPREAGDVLIAHAALCTAHEIDMDDAGRRALDLCWANIDKTRAKRAAKPSFAPQPIEVQPDTEALEMAEAAAFSTGFEAGERAEREACAMLASVRADSLDDAIKWGGGKVYLTSLKGGLIELRNLAAAIRKRGEGKG